MEGDVQLAPEGSGPPVRTLALLVPDGVDGATKTIHIQVIAATDENGDLLRSSAFQQELLAEIRGLRQDLRLAMAELDVHHFDDEVGADEHVG
jgi:hypothetical protein